jgi:hypothetical protein
MNNYFLAGYGIDKEQINSSRLSINGSEKIAFHSLELENNFSLHTFSASEISIQFKQFKYRTKDILVLDESNSKENELEKLCKEISTYEYGSIMIDRAINEYLSNILVIIVDHSLQKLALYTDRFGLFPIYHTTVNNNLCLSNDIKVFRCLSSFNQKISDDAIRCFIYSGQLIGELSWFENVYLLPAKACLQYDSRLKKMNQHTIWSWNQIKQLDISFTEAKETALQLFKKSVNSRISSQRSNSIFLSGGRDSSAILLAQHKNRIDSSYSLLSKENLRTRKTVKRLAKDLNFESIILDENRGLSNVIKTNKIWDISCAISSLHMHFAPYEDVFKPEQNYFNGIPGDLNIGGTFLLDKSNRITIETAVAHPSKYCHYLSEYLSFLNDSFYDFKNEDPFYFDTRVKRFTLRGMNYLSIPHHSFPFHDLELNNFIYSINDDFLRNRKLYNSLLLDLGYFEYDKRNYYYSIRSRLVHYMSFIHSASKAESKSSPKILDFIKKNQLEINSKVPLAFIQERVSSLQIWLQMLDF